MRAIRHCAHVAILTLVTVAFASPAFAQKIRSYGDSASSGNSGGQSASGNSGASGWYPGMPAPQQSQGTQQAAASSKRQPLDASGEGGEGEDSVGPSHRITIFSGDKKSDGTRATLDLALEKLYRGVIPGTRDDVEHLARAKKDGTSSAKPNQLTWLGFRPTDESTRVFFQTARKSDYRIRRKQSPAVIEVTLSNTGIPARNFSRFIDTSFFKRNVKLVEATKEGSNTVKISIKLETFEQPTVRQDGNYVYLDFPYNAPDKDKKVDNGENSK